MDHAVWRLRQQSRSLQSTRADARGVWADEAARTIEQRFLRPQLDADEEMQSQLQLQVTESGRCSAKVDAAQETGNQAVEASAACGEQIADSSRSTQTAFHYIQHARDAEIQATAHIHSTLAAIDSANAACGGVMRDPHGPGPLQQVQYSAYADVPATVVGAASEPAGGAASDRYPWLASINAPGGPGRTQNCVSCAIAVDDALGGDVRPASTSEGPAPVGVLQDRYGGSFTSMSESDIRAELTSRGDGARGIVFGDRGGQPGHVFNAVNDGGVIRFLDGQAGGDGVFDPSFVATYFLNTN